MQGFPLLAVQPQGLGQGPGIQPVGLVAAGRFALAIAFGAERVDRIKGAVQREQLIHGRSLVGFDRDGQRRIRLNFIAERLPARPGMFDAKVSDDLTLAIHDDDLVMVAGPVEAGGVRAFNPRFHSFALGCSHRSAVESHPDPRSLAGCGSLRHYDSRG